MAHDPTRRMLITALAGLTLANVSLASAATGNANVQGKSRNIEREITRLNFSHLSADRLPSSS